MLPIQNIKLEVAGFTLPAIFRPGKSGRPLLFCIHGGSYTGHYFNYASQPADSFFAMAGAKDFPIMAVTRPGYHADNADSPDFKTQAALLAAAMADLRKTHALNAPVCLIGHSIGAHLALIMAAEHNIPDLISLDISGYGMRYHDHARRGFTKFLAMDNPPLEANADARQRRMFGPQGTYDPEVLAEDIAEAPTTRMGDMLGLLDMEGALGRLAPNVSVPVHFSLGEHDALWQTTSEDIQLAKTAFAHVPHAHFRIQPNVGHCLHLHKDARAINLHTLTFIDEVVDARRSA